jgi:hypothetical protein
MDNTSTFYNYVKNSFSIDDMNEINKHGCVNGISGITYYEETADIFEKYGDDILEIYEDYRDDHGAELNIDYSSVSRMYNSFVWAAIEVVVDDILNTN